LLAGCANSPAAPEQAPQVGERSQQLSQHPSSSRAGHYTLFEAGPVRPIAVLPRGVVAVANIPDDRVELFESKHGGLSLCGSVKVGMRPVALSAVNGQLWVANHLSDSVSVVSIDEQRCDGRVERTLQVGDEPRDIVSARAATGKQYVFVTTAHRGQNVRNADGSERDPQLTTAGVGRADVFVYDAASLEADQRPATILTLFTDSPRALAVGDGKVFAAGFMSGNQTSLVRYQLVVERGRQSLARLDANADLQIDEALPPEARTIEGGMPAVRGHGRCVSGTLSTPPGQERNDFWADVCVQTDPEAPTRALKIIPQYVGQITPECSCLNSAGELQITSPLIVQFFESPAVCGSSYDAQRGGCWLEPPQADIDLANPPEPLGSLEWNDEVALSLPDRDVFTIDLAQTPPALVPGGDFRHVGTTLFSMAVHPKSGKVFVGNTDARNLIRFEGPGTDIAQEDNFSNTTVRGHIAESRISVLDPRNAGVKDVHLNAHIDYTQCCAEGPNPETERSLAFPVALAISSKRGKRGELLDAQDLFVAALGSDKVAVLNTAAIEAAERGQAVQSQRQHIEVRGGPSGLTLDEKRDRLYVLARFSNELVVIDTRSRSVVERHKLFSPEPQHIVHGRPFLYDARRTSSHGDSACASCHLFGDLDGLSWDLGGPNDRDFANFGPFFAKPEVTSSPLVSRFLALKGPMSTQSLRGLANHGSMHWRGDRRGGLTSTEHAQPDTGAFDENAAFNAFNVAFAGLNGRASELSEADMQKFTDFALAITYPPNPIRSLDDGLTEGQKRARSRYFGCEVSDESMALRQCADGRDIDEEQLGCNCLNPPEFVLGLEPRPAHCPPDPKCTLDVSDFQNTCNGCHLLDPDANAEFGVDKPGLFGSAGFYTNDGVAHVLKVPHLRNMYQKVGMFGSVQTRRGVGLTNFADSIFGARRGGLFAAANALTGDQVRGFGFTHAGEEDTMFHFFSASGFARAAASPPALVNDNRAGFESILPRDTQTCYGAQLPALNQQFLAELGPPEVVQQLRQDLQVFTNPASTPAARAAAFAALSGFLSGLPANNPGSVFQRLPMQTAVTQLSLPLLACPSLPPVLTLQTLGCFDIRVGTGCASLINTVRGCAQWGATLEQVMPNGVEACHAAGFADKADMESFMFAFESNLKPIVGQQVTLTGSSSAQANTRLELLIEQAERGHCDLVAHSGAFGFVYEAKRFLRHDGVKLTLNALIRRATPSAPLTFTAVPPREGRRSGVDRDEDGLLDAFDLRPWR
jgi:DNA-binding beta-propeller fold protein YncE